MTQTSRGPADAQDLDRHRPQLLKYATMQLRNHAQAEDAVQETLMAALRGADSFAGRLASIIQGSTETTFYVLAVYFGAVGIKRVRHAVACGLIADQTRIKNRLTNKNI